MKNKLSKLMLLFFLPLLINCKKENDSILNTLDNKIVLSETINPDITPPSDFTVSVVGANDTSCKLKWTKSTDDVGVVGYKIYYKELGGYVWYLSGSTTDTFYTVNNIALMNWYYDFYVQAFDAAGNSTSSNVVRQNQTYIPPTIDVVLNGKVKGVTYTLNWVTNITPSGFTVKNTYVQYYQGGVWGNIYSTNNSSTSGTFSIQLTKKMTVPWRILVVLTTLDFKYSNVITLSS